MTATTTAPTGGALSRTRRVARARTLLVLSSALSRSAVMVTSTASTLLVAHTAGASWAGLPGAVGVGAVAIGSLVLTLMRAKGRRFGLITGYATALAVHGTSLSDRPVRM